MVDYRAAVDDVITVEHCRKNYGKVVAVEDVSFDVARGEIFGLLGPNGAGKTTIVECLQGLRRRDGGRVEVLGIDPATHPDRLRRRVGSQLQSSALPDRLRVGEAVKLFGSLHRGVDVDQTLREWDLHELRRRSYAALSGGQRQRLFLALALLGQPEVVFLDELTTGLDPHARRATWDLVRGVRERGATVLLVTHFMEEAEALCDRVAIVDRGRIVAQDRPDALTAQFGGGIRMTFTVPGDSDLSYLETVPGVSSVKTADRLVTVTGEARAAVPVAAALAERGCHPADFRTHYPTLEDVFLAMTGRTLREQA